MDRDDALDDEFRQWWLEHENYDPDQTEGMDWSMDEFLPCLGCGDCSGCGKVQG